MLETSFISLPLVMKLSLLSSITTFLPALSSTYAAVTWTATPFNPPAVPLAVKTPYLSCWLNQGTGTALNAAWPTFWTGSILGWAGYIKVDGVTFTFLGAPVVAGSQLAVQTTASFTSTQSTFVLTAGPVSLTANFLSPVVPGDLTRQSLPFSYLALSVKSNDGAAHSVQVYTDISAEWVTGDNTLLANWTTDSTTNDLITHKVQLQTQQIFTEVNDHIQQGSAFYSIKNGTGVTFQSGQDSVVRAQFINGGKLLNTQDTQFRAVQDRWPVFGLSKDLGSIVSTSTPVVFVVGHVRDPAIQYIVAGNTLQSRSSFFFSTHSTAADALNFFMNDFSTAMTTAAALDQKVNTKAASISADYAGIVALSVRQAFGATEVTVGKTSVGTLNTSDILVFLKEISSDGNVNTVDVIMPSWPAYLYVAPTYGRFLLEGLLRYQSSGLYPNKWSVHDLGSSYPKALGHNDGADEAMPVEESGNMLIMALSYTQATNDLSLITQYYNTLDQFTQFLITDSLIPANQLSTDDFAGTLANQTNLAIKGTIGIKAMSVIAGLLGKSDIAANYSSIAASYVPQILSFATSSDGKHLELAYNNSTSWGLSYNLYADKLLKTNVFPASTFNMQTAWYTTVARTFGVPLDTRHTYTKADWEIWTAAIMTNTAARDLFISSVRKYAASGVNSAPMSDWYETINGVAQGFRARPVVGGYLALMVL